MLRLTSGSVMSGLGGYRAGARGLIRHADSMLSKELPIIRSVEVGLSAFTFGMLQGKFHKSGGLTLGLPVDLIAGAGLHLINFFGYGKSYSHHLSAIADGALASFFTTTGYKVGQRWGEGAGFVPALKGAFSSSSGEAKAPAGGSTLADAELASLVRAG